MARNHYYKNYTTQEKVDAYEAVIGVFNEVFKELKELGKKKPEATLSTGKVRLLNRVLTDVAALLEGAPDRKYLDLLDDETLPQYSDAILTLAQYDGALKAFYSRHHGYDAASFENIWFVQATKKK